MGTTSPVLDSRGTVPKLRHWICVPANTAQQCPEPSASQENLIYLWRFATEELLTYLSDLCKGYGWVLPLIFRLCFNNIPHPCIQQPEQSSASPSKGSKGHLWGQLKVLLRSQSKLFPNAGFCFCNLWSCNYHDTLYLTADSGDPCTSLSPKSLCLQIDSFHHLQMLRLPLRLAPMTDRHQWPSARSCLYNRGPEQIQTPPSKHPSECTRSFPRQGFLSLGQMFPAHSYYPFKFTRSSSLSCHLIQLTNRWWSVDSSARIFTRVSMT